MPPTSRQSVKTKRTKATPEPSPELDQSAAVVPYSPDGSPTPELVASVAEYPPESFNAAAQLLMARLDSLYENGDPESVALLRARACAAAFQLAQASARTRRTVLPIERDMFLICLAAGLGVHAAADAVNGPALSSYYEHRRRDPDFNERWNDALDASLDTVDARIFEIGLHGQAHHMATVKALELARRGRARAERRDLAVTVGDETPDGQRRILHVSLSTPGPD